MVSFFARKLFSTIQKSWHLNVVSESVECVNGISKPTIDDNDIIVLQPVDDVFFIIDENISGNRRIVVFAIG